MKLNGFSSYTISNSMRDTVSKTQSSMIKSQYEAAIGRYYDMSEELGYKVGRLLNTQARTEILKKYKSDNDILKGRLDIAQKSLSSLTNSDGTSKGLLQNFLKNILALNTVENNQNEIALQEAKSSIRDFYSIMNTTYGGTYIFGGKESKVQPLKDYSPGSGQGMSKKLQDLFNDFVEKNVEGKDPKNITAKQMDDFLNNIFAAQFEGDNWKENFSNASDDVDDYCVNENGENVPSGVSCNEENFKKALKSMCMVAELTSSLGLSNEMLAHIREKAANVLSGSVITDTLTVQSKIGTYQSRVDVVNHRMENQLAVLNNVDNALASVDKAEASTRLMTLQTDLNLAFQLTSRISKLSLANYI